MELIKKKDIDMLSGPIFKGMFAMSLPLIMTNIFQLLFNTADLVIVGRLAGDNCLGAVTATTFIIQVVIAVFIGISTGVNVLIARLIGENKKESIKESINTAMTFGLLSGIVLGVIGILISRWTLEMTSCPPELIELADVYLDIYYLSMPGALMFNYGAAALRAKGDTKTPLYFLFLSGVINVMLNIVMIVCFNMTVDGVAIATVISQYISTLLILIVLNSEKGDFHFDLKNMRIDIVLLEELLRLGIPAGFQSCLFSISNVILQSAFNSFGHATTTAVGAAHTLESFTNAIVQGVALTCMTYVSQNYGAKNYERIKKSILITLLIGFIWSMLITAFGMFCSNFYMSIYSKDPEIISLGALKVRYSMCLYETYMLMQTGAMTMRGLNHSKTPTFMSLMGVIGVRLFIVFTIFKAYPLYEVLLTSYPASWIVSDILIWPTLFKQLKKAKIDLCI